MTWPGRRPPEPDFDGMYRRDPDPWDVAGSWYEQRKLAVLLSALPSARYRSGWEPGCGPGITTMALASRVDDLLATDGSAVAVDLARKRCAGWGHVRIERSTLPDVPTDRRVDLVVVAEFLYYVADLGPALDALWSAAAPGAHVTFLHWAHDPHDAHRSGTQMHESIAEDAQHRGATMLVSHADSDFVLDVYEAVPS